MPTKSATKGTPVALHTLATTGNGQVLAIPTSFKNHSIIIKGSAGLSSGAVQPEYSDDPDYTGTWAAIGSPITPIVGEVATQFVGIYPFIRARISTTIGGGTVSINYIGS